VTNRGKWWYSAALSEFKPLFLNGAQRSVNRKVQGSNPCPGAKFEYGHELSPGGIFHPVQQFCSNLQQFVDRESIRRMVTAVHN
jgi:hypothetical protein